MQVGVSLLLRRNFLNLNTPYKNFVQTEIAFHPKISEVILADSRYLKMATTYSLMILLFTIFGVGMVDMTLATRIISEDDLPVNKFHRKNLLPHEVLKNDTKPTPDSLFPVWGKGIIFKVDKTSMLRDTEFLFIWRVAQHIGHVEYVTSAMLSSKKEKTERPWDVFGYSVWLLPQSISRINFLNNFIPNDMCVMVMRNKPHRHSIMESFRDTMWIATFVSLVQFYVVLSFLKRRSMFFETFQTFLVGSFNEHRSVLINFLFILLSSYGLIMTNAFSGKFMSFLAVMGEAQQLQTLEEVNDQVSVFYATKSVELSAKHFESDDPIRRLVKKVPSSGNWNDMKRQITSSPKYAYVTSSTQYEGLSRSRGFVDASTGRPLIHLVPNCILSPSYTVYLANKKWPHVERFSVLLQRAVEGGIDIKAKSDSEYIKIKIGELIRETPQSDVPEPLTTAAMLEPVVVLGSGAALAAGVFAFEILSFRWRQRRLRKDTSVLSSNKTSNENSIFSRFMRRIRKGRSS